VHARARLPKKISNNGLLNTRVGRQCVTFFDTDALLLRDKRNAPLRCQSQSHYRAESL
jgi:hypothetical protein